MTGRERGERGRFAKSSGPPPVIPPRAGPGRPAKPRAPRTEHQEALAEAIERAEATRDGAAIAYATDGTVAAELKLLRAELGVSLAWAGYLRAQGLHTHALQYTNVGAKLAGRLAGLREIEAADLLAELAARANREDAAAAAPGAI